MAKTDLAPIGVAYDDLEVQTRQVVLGDPQVTGEFGEFTRVDEHSIVYVPSDPNFTGTDWAFVALLNSATSTTIMTLSLVCNVKNGSVVEDSDWLAFRPAYLQTSTTSSALSLTVLNAAADMANWTFVVQLHPDTDGAATVTHEYSYAQFSAGAVQFDFPNDFSDNGNSIVTTYFKTNFSGSSTPVQGGESNTPLRYLSNFTQLALYTESIDQAAGSARIRWDFADRIAGAVKQKLTVSNANGQTETPLEPLTHFRVITDLTPGVNGARVDFTDADGIVLYTLYFSIQMPNA